MTTKDVVLNINMSHEQPGAEPESMELVTNARYSRDGDKTYIEYEESELTGLEGSVTKIMLEGDERVTLERDGKYTMALVLEQGKRYFGAYSTPYGILDLAVSPSQVHIEQTDEKLELQMNYAMTVAGTNAGTFDMRISSKF